VTRGQTIKRVVDKESSSQPFSKPAEETFVLTNLILQENRPKRKTSGFPAESRLQPKSVPLVPGHKGKKELGPIEGGENMKQWS